MVRLGRVDMSYLARGLITTLYHEVVGDTGGVCVGGGGRPCDERSLFGAAGAAFPSAGRLLGSVILLAEVCAVTAGLLCSVLVVSILRLLSSHFSLVPKMETLLARMAVASVTFRTFDTADDSFDARCRGGECRGGTRTRTAALELRLDAAAGGCRCRRAL